MYRFRLTIFSLSIVALLFAGCGGLNLFANQTASLGGSTAGGRGSFQVLIINNTPFRAAFVAGSYDQTDMDSQPDFEMFGKDNEEDGIDGNSQSGLTFQCARVFAIGSKRLNAFIQENIDLETLDDDIAEDALIEGVEFYSVAEDGTTTSQGIAPAREFLIGVDYQCGGFLIFRLEFDDVGPNPFRIEYEWIPSEDDR